MTKYISQNIYRQKNVIIVFFIVMTALFAGQIVNLDTSIGLKQSLPANHPFIKTAEKYQSEFGSANQVLISLEQKQGDIFNAEYMQTLESLSKQVSQISGVNQSRIISLFSPSVRFTEITEEGFTGGTVLPENFTASQKDLDELRIRIFKSEQARQLVSDNFNASMVIFELTEFDSNTGTTLNYKDVASELKTLIRDKFDKEPYQIQIIGFAELMAEINSAIDETLWYFLTSFILVFLILRIALRNTWLALLPVFCTSSAIIILLGMLSLLNIAMHPFGIFIPFLIFAIGTSHSLQLVQALKSKLENSVEFSTAIIQSHSRLLIPGLIALLSDCIGFVTILLIDIPVIKDMAIAASMGIVILILSNLILLPALLVRFHQHFSKAIKPRSALLDKLWPALSHAASHNGSYKVLFVFTILLVTGSWQASKLVTGDIHVGVPELRENAQYNQALNYFTNSYSRGSDLLIVYARTEKDGCINYNVMQAIDNVVWELQQLPTILDINSLSQSAKNINSGWHEGSLKWHNLPNHHAALSETIAPIETNSGLLNHDCSVMPIYLYLTDHKAETIHTVIKTINQLAAIYSSKQLSFELASGSMATFAATNDVLEHAQLPILISIYLAIALLCFVMFRSIRATLCIILPLGLASVLCYALMVTLEIGLKISTLPVIALGAGIGVDYAIYLFSYFQRANNETKSIEAAYVQTLQTSGKAIVYTALTLSASLAIWIFSPLNYQADMGLLLGFMFLVNMLAALIFIPALIRQIYKPS